MSNTKLEKLEKLKARGTQLLSVSHHPMPQKAINEFEHLVKQWQKRVQADTPRNELSRAFQDEVSDFAKHIFGLDCYAYFGSEMCMLIEQLFGVSD